MTRKRKGPPPPPEGYAYVHQLVKPGKHSRQGMIGRLLCTTMRAQHFKWRTMHFDPINFRGIVLGALNVYPVGVWPLIEALDQLSDDELRAACAKMPAPKRGPHGARKPQPDLRSKARKPARMPVVVMRRRQASAEESNNGNQK